MKIYLTLIAFALTYHAIYSQDECSSDTCSWNRVYIKAGFLNCSDYSTSLYDEFNGTSLNTNIWQTKWHGAGRRLNTDNDEALYLDANVQLDGNGHCQLIGKHEPGTTWLDPTNNTEYIRDITTGMIQVKTSYDVFRFGKYEASIKIAGTGWYPAFWLWHFDEIDIMENFWNDTAWLYNFHGYCSNTNPYSAPINDGNFHKFGVEWTPFKITYFYNDIQLPTVYYRFYRADGSPLDVTCSNNIIPEGYYYINPLFPQVRSRGFNPIINNAVLPKYGNGACPIQLGCNAPYCFTCGKHNPPDENCSYGYPIEPQFPNNGLNDPCVYTGQFPGITEIDFVKVQERDYEICNSVMIYGDNCEATNPFSHSKPLTCQRITCLNETNSIYLEDLGANTNNWLAEVQSVNSVQSSSDIQIISFDNYKIDYKLINNNGLREIYITFHDICGVSQTVTYKPMYFPSIEIVLDEINACDGKATFLIKNHFGCPRYVNEMDIIRIELVDYWGGLHYINHTLHLDTIFLNYDGQYLIKGVNIYIKNKCNNELETFNLSIPICDECCPAGSGFDGENCYFGIHYNGVTGFILNNTFYTTTNCILYRDNDCCPPGSVFDGANCYWGIHFPGYDGFILSNTLYTKPNCITCCPPGSVFDGANCYFGIHFTGVTGFVLNNTFYTTTNCNLYRNNDCCPPGSVFDGANCYWGIHFSDEYEGFVYNNSFYTTPADCNELNISSSNNEIEARSTNNEERIIETAENTLIFYPNPFYDNLNILINKKDWNKCKVIMYSLTNEKVFETSILPNGSLNINIPIEFPSGIYFIKSSIDNENYITKIIKI